MTSISALCRPPGVMQDDTAATDAELLRLRADRVAFARPSAEDDAYGGGPCVHSDK